jgi:hypothetical protein
MKARYIFVAFMGDASRHVVKTDYAMHAYALPLTIVGKGEARALIGPFRTMRGARFMAQRGCQCENVAQSEAAAKDEAAGLAR